MRKLTTLFCALCVALIAAPALSAGDAEAGKEVFAQCGVCHNVDKPEKKIGPSLMGLYKKDTMANGKKTTDENVMAVINEGGGGMPAYQDILTDEEKSDMLEYLKTL